MTDKEIYNNKTSIDINTLTEDEVKLAVKQWAEGDIYLEQFLWKCYKEGVETKQSNKAPGVFIEFSADKNVQKIKKIINSVFNETNFSIYIAPDGGSCFGSSNFYKAGITIFFNKYISEKENKKIFDKMTKSFDSDMNVKNPIIDSMIDLYNFFNMKESDLNFRYVTGNLKDKNINFSGCGKYTFIVETTLTNNYEYYCDLLPKIGLIKDLKINGNWYFSSDNINDFSNKLEIIKNNLINKYDLQIPNKIDDNMHINEKFRLLRRLYYEKDGNDLKFNEFKNEFELKLKEMEYKYNSNKVTAQEANEWLFSILRQKEAELTDNKSQKI